MLWRIAMQWDVPECSHSVELSMEPEFRRGHGSVYAALDQGRIDVDRLPDGRKPTKDLWLWHAGPVGVDADLVDLLWKACLRRFDQEHFHRFAKVYLGMARAHLSSAQATDRWMHLIMAAYADRNRRQRTPRVTLNRKLSRRSGGQGWPWRRRGRWPRCGASRARSRG
jgi:hypothetical protein